MLDNNKKVTDDILKRIVRLERAVFLTRKTASRKIASEGEFSGPKGGVLLLISKGFFTRQRSAAQVMAELKGMGYIGYRRQVIHNALNRLSASKGPLISSIEGGVRIYAKRK
ncbi:hypothetical protein K8R04_02800 [Candidatus Uhrbacteria bacterium]|nr:hypothetical protein [Candidatus Uhrbacteria bacterium]